MSAAATYLALADLLEQHIGALATGDRLPSEHSLAAEHEVNRLTARAALQELERRYLVRRVQGAGTFVARRIEYRIGTGSLPSLTETLAALGVAAVQRNGRPRSARPSAGVRTELRLDRSERVTVIERVTEIDGEPVGCSTSHLCSTLVPGLASVLPTEGSLFAVLRDVYGLQPERVRSRVELEVAPREVARTLRLDGRPLAWSLTSVNRSRSRDRLVEVSSGWLRADLFRVVFEVGGP